LGKFDRRSDEATFLGYLSHSKAYKVFNKGTLCVEESVHVLFDETNSLIENDAQDEEFKLGLARKDLLLIHEKGKSPMNASGPGAVSLEGRQGLNQSGGSTAEPSLEQKQSNFPRIGLGTDFRTGPERGSRTGFKLVLLSSSARMESKYVNPRPWKHQSSHPLDQILSDINTGVQTRSKLKNYCTFYAFLSIIERRFISLKGIRCGTLYHSQRIEQSLAPSGCSETSLMSSEQSLGTRPS